MRASLDGVLRLRRMRGARMPFVQEDRKVVAQRFVTLDSRLENHLLDVARKTPPERERRAPDQGFAMFIDLIHCPLHAIDASSIRRCFRPEEPYGCLNVPVIEHQLGLVLIAVEATMIGRSGFHGLLRNLRISPWTRRSLTESLLLRRAERTSASSEIGRKVQCKSPFTVRIADLPGVGSRGFLEAAQQGAG